MDKAQCAIRSSRVSTGTDKHMVLRSAVMDVDHDAC